MKIIILTAIFYIISILLFTSKGYAAENYFFEDEFNSIDLTKWNVFGPTGSVFTLDGRMVLSPINGNKAAL